MFISYRYLPYSPRISAQLEEVSRLVTRKLESTVEAADPNRIWSKRKAIGVLFPYAVWREQRGMFEMLDALLHATRALKGFEQVRAGPFALTLPSEASARAVVLVSPHVSSWFVDGHENQVSRWAAASAVAGTEEFEVCRSVVDTLLHIASIDPLRSYIPIGTWAWLGRQPSLPPEFPGQSNGTDESVLRQVRALGDIKILKSYLLAVWSEWDFIGSGFDLFEIQISIQEDFGGIEMRHHREDLVKRLDHIVLGQLDQRLGHPQRHKPNISEDIIRLAREEYKAIKRTLLDVDGKEVNAPIRMPPMLTGLRLLTHA